MVLWVSRVFIWCVIIVTLIPLWFVVIAALNPTNSYFSTSFWPTNVSFANFHKLFTETTFLTGLRVSAMVSVCVAIGQVLLTATGAFAFSKLRFWGRKYGLMTLLIIQMFPNFLAIAAIYAALSKLGLVDQIWAYIIVLLGGSAYQMWLMKGYFDSIPKELDEAALIDGASSWQRFWKIILPLSVPMLTVIIFFQLISSFDEYILAGTILQSPEKANLGVVMYGLISDNQGQEWGVFAAAALLTATPLAIVFGLLQKWISTGLTAGATKG
nr:ABC transporter permease subunit [Pullulanibacillus pueri]